MFWLPSPQSKIPFSQYHNTIKWHLVALTWSSCSASKFLPTHGAGAVQLEPRNNAPWVEAVLAFKLLHGLPVGEILSSARVNFFFFIISFQNTSQQTEQDEFFSRIWLEISTYNHGYCNNKNFLCLFIGHRGNVCNVFFGHWRGACPVHVVQQLKQ